jgi:hypothetical protein
MWMPSGCRILDKTSNDFFFQESKQEFLRNVGATMKSQKTAFDEGSTRGTGFIPGYQGYIPVDTQNQLVIQYSKQDRKDHNSEGTRQKEPRKMPGYTGYRRQFY